MISRGDFLQRSRKSFLIGSANRFLGQQRRLLVDNLVGGALKGDEVFLPDGSRDGNAFSFGLGKESVKGGWLFVVSDSALIREICPSGGCA